MTTTASFVSTPVAVPVPDGNFASDSAAFYFSSGGGNSGGGTFTSP